MSLSSPKKNYGVHYRKKMNSKALRHFERARDYDQTDPERAQRHRQRGRELQFGISFLKNKNRKTTPEALSDEKCATFAKSVLSYAATAAFCCKGDSTEKNFIADGIVQYPPTEYGGGMTALNLLDLIDGQTDQNPMSSYLTKVWHHHFTTPNKNTEQLKKIAGKIIVYVAYMAYVNMHGAYRKALMYHPGLKDKVHGTVVSFLRLNSKNKIASEYWTRVTNETFDKAQLQTHSKTLSKGLDILFQQITEEKATPDTLPNPPKYFASIDATGFNGGLKESADNESGTQSSPEMRENQSAEIGKKRGHKRKEHEKPNSEKTLEEAKPHTGPTSPSDNSSDLLEQVRKGTTLRTVNSAETTPPDTNRTSNTDARSYLLQQAEERRKRMKPDSTPDRNAFDTDEI